MPKKTEPKDTQSTQPEQVQQVRISDIHPFKNHPFKVVDDALMQETVDSIMQFGVLNPTIIRPDPGGGYEMVAGHRRLHASGLAGKDTIPAIVRNLTDDEAVILLVDTNLQRENISPMERAQAYKMKMEALKHQGQRTDLTSTQVGRKLETAEIIAQQTGESKNQVRRFVRLTELVPELQTIEGDIQGCFDNINHEKLIDILSRKIKDSRFLNIIRQFLKAGYIENWKYNATYSGSPQGGICSPILANIYLNELDKKFREIAERFDKPRSAYQTPEYHAASKELKRLSYWIDHTADEAARQELIDQHRAQKEAMRNLPCKPADNKKFTFVRYADDWLAGVCGTKAECEDLKAEIAEFLSTELKLTLSEEKTLITHSSEKVRFIGYDICVRRNQEVKGHRMKNGTWRKSRTLHMKVALSVPHTEKIEKFMFAKKVIRQKENGEFQPIHRAGLLNLADYEIVEQYNAEARGLCNYYNLACDYHTLDYFCYLMEYSCLKTIANKHKTSIRKIIRQYKDGKTWSVPYETKAGTKRVRPVKIADCKRGEASDIIYQRKKFSWKTTIRQRLNARVCELCGCKEADLYEVHVIRNLNELGNSDWETVMKKKRRKTLVVCSKCHERIHRH